MTDETTPTPPATDAVIPVPGSHRDTSPGATTSGGLPPGTRVEATIVLRRKAELDVAALAGALSREELADRFGASGADVDAVTAWASSVGLTVEQVDAGSRRVRVAGAVEDVTRAFGTDLEQAELAGVRYRQRSGDLHVPSNLADVVVAVLGIDDRRQAETRFLLAPEPAAAASFTPPELATIYAMPTDADGTGETVAIVELGGGYADSELATYFDSIGVAHPTVTSVGVDGGTNVPGGDPSGADGEVLLDIEVVGGIAPGASIVVYFAPNTDAGFVDAVSQAAHATPTPVAMSISWGQSEDDWTAQARTAMDQALADATALGVTVTAAAGDDGSTDRATGGGVHVDFPASSPHALACGGTSLRASGGTVTSETVWGGVAGNGATGGGVSDVFALPSWQAGAGVPKRSGTSTTGRGVPDVSAVADPQTGYQVLVDGSSTVIGGTSAVAPLWAGLLARLAQKRGKPLGLAQPALYAGIVAGTVSPGFRDIVSGTNGAYRAGPGWDACTGLGVPDGQALLTALQAGGPAATADR